MAHTNITTPRMSGSILTTAIGLAAMAANAVMFYVMNGLNVYDRYADVTSMTAGSWMAFAGMIVLAYITVQAFARTDSGIIYTAAFLLSLVSIPYALLYGTFAVLTPSTVSLVNIIAIAVVNSLFIMQKIDDLMNR